MEKTEYIFRLHGVLGRLRALRCVLGASIHKVRSRGENVLTNWDSAENLMGEAEECLSRAAISIRDALASNTKTTNPDSLN